MTRGSLITHDSFVEMRGTLLREHNCQGMPVFSKEPFPILPWKYQVQYSVVLFKISLPAGFDCNNRPCDSTSTP
jgi:hypothetical protein